ncbi:protein amalgam [Drosophila ficusphila]|uniref:protein amalgam n=1 Tax=Drosophila ficusphila TaxID=30025 RepID=UPI0007E64E11|nr:protein amalgam [Drosophila ficusphila]XP_017042705.1 protein amalgam [Drosophila ficusphila]
MASLQLYIGLLLGLAISSDPVLGGPVISQISKDVVASVGDTVEFNCTVEQVGQLSVSWAKGTSESDASSVVLSIRNILSLPDQRYNVTVTEGAKAGSATYSFRIQKIEVSDMGPYECQVLVSATEKVSKKLSLQIKTPAVVSESTPKSTLVTEGQNLELTCHANGFPKPTISWAREHNAVMPAGGHVLFEPTLRIRTVHRTDRGGYYCIAQNGEGQPDKRLVRVEVEFRPQIAVQRPKVAQMVSHSAELECSVQGYPAPTVVWHRNGVALQSSRQHEVAITASSSETTTSVLRIESVAEEDFGDYYCNATNKLGHADARLHLFQTVIPVPSASS